MWLKLHRSGAWLLLLTSCCLYARDESVSGLNLSCGFSCGTHGKSPSMFFAGFIYRLSMYMFSGNLRTYFRKYRSSSWRVCQHCPRVTNPRDYTHDPHGLDSYSLNIIVLSSCCVCSAKANASLFVWVSCHASHRPHQHAPNTSPTTVDLFELVYLFTTFIYVAALAAYVYCLGTGSLCGQRSAGFHSLI